MQSIEIIIALVMASVPLALIARRLRLPDPLMLVIGGAALTLVPGLPDIPIEPRAIFTIFLPPILYQAALHLPWAEFSASLRPILVLAVGLVLATMLAIGSVAHWMIPGLPFAAAMVLGAILSPSDPTAAIAIMGRLRIPRRIVVVVEGESIVNDATGLVLFGLATEAVMSGAFDIRASVPEFVFVSAGGVIVGLAVAALVEFVHILLRDSELEVVWNFIPPFAAYLAADAAHTSGILAVLAVGLTRGAQAPFTLGAHARLVGHHVLDAVAFVLNSLIFVLIGLQMHRILEGLAAYSWQSLVAAGAAVSATLIAARVIWVFATNLIARTLSARDPWPWKHATLVSWSGMRGILSLAAALAIPKTLATGAPFPGRNLIVFLTFFAILTTLILQSATLRWLIGALGIDAAADFDPEEHRLRREMARAALRAVRGLAAEHGEAELAPFRAMLERDLAEATLRHEAEPPIIQAERQAIWRHIFLAQRQRLLLLAQRGQMKPEVFARLLRELDHIDLSLE